MNDISFALPFAFLETDPFKLGIGPIGPGDQVRVSYSQSFGYSFVGGDVAYPGGNRLGAQIIPSNAVPEPMTLSLLASAVIGLGITSRRRRSSR